MFINSKDILDPTGLPRSQSYKEAIDDANINPATARYQLSTNLLYDYVDIVNKHQTSVVLCSSDTYNEMLMFSNKSVKKEETWFKKWFKKFPDTDKL